MPQERIHSLAYRTAAWVLTAVALILILLLHLLPALLAGMLVYELVHVMEPAIHKRFPERAETLIAVALLSALVVVLMTAAIFGLVAFFNSDAGSVSALLTRMAEIIETSRATMPDWLFGSMPTEPDDLREEAVQWLRAHSAAVQLAGAEVGRALLYIFVGMILGAMISLHERSPVRPHRILAHALTQRVVRLG